VEKFLLQRPVLRAGAKKISPAARDAVRALLSTLDSFLHSTKWFAGGNLTLADLAILGSVGTIIVSGALCLWIKCLTFINFSAGELI
jgi:glutathione S-transferase